MARSLGSHVAVKSMVVGVRQHRRHFSHGKLCGVADDLICAAQRVSVECIV